jgi:ethanolamine permease
MFFVVLQGLVVLFWENPLDMFIESFEYIILTAVEVYFIGQTCTILFNTNPDIEPLWWLLFYLISAAIQIRGKGLFWISCVLAGAVSLLLFIVYIFGSIKFVSFGDNAAYSSATVLDPTVAVGRWLPSLSSSGTILFFQAFPSSMWMFIGIEELPLCAEETINPKKTIPKAIIAVILTLICISYSVAFITASTPPGIEISSSTYTPLFNSLQLMFNTADIRYLYLYFFLPLLYTAHINSFGYSRQIFSMSRSGYLPSILSSVFTAQSTPYAAVLFGSLVGYLLLFFIKYTDPLVYTTVFFNLAVVFSLLNYLIQIISFIIFKYSYPLVQREFHSPLGYIGAVYSFLVFLLTLLTMLIYQPNIDKTMYIFLVLLTVSILYYVLYSRYHLLLSEEEKFALFIIYSIQFIRNKQKQVLSPNKYAASRQLKNISIHPTKESVRNNEIRHNQNYVSPQESVH